MTGYLSVANFWKYQDKGAWKKSKTHPPWFKHFVHRDRELDRLPLPARLLFFELLGAATRYSNVLEADLNWISAETRIGPEQIAESLPLLLKGGWLSQTKSRRRGAGSGAGSPPTAAVQDVDVDVDEEKDLSAHTRPTTKSTDGALFALRTMVANGAIPDHEALYAEVRARGIDDIAAAALKRDLEQRLGTSTPVPRDTGTVASR